MVRPRVAVIASGNGSTFRAVAEAVRDGLVDFDICLVISTSENAGILDHVKKLNMLNSFEIKTEIINKKRYPNGAQGRGQTREEAEATIKALKDNNIDHLALMGCMRIIAPQVIDEFGWKPQYVKQDPQHKGIYLARMSNTHPGILPATADTHGIYTQEKVLELELDVTAHTFHVVAAGVDTGPVIAENFVPVCSPSMFSPDMADTPQKLFDRVQRIEKAHLPIDLDMFLKRQALYKSEQKTQI